VTGHYWRGLNAMLSAFSYGEPFFKVGIGAVVGKWLIENGLVEEVQDRPWSSNKPCYRLTDLGHAVIRRGRYASSSPPPRRPKIAEPRLKTAPPRIKPL